jgi:hypothetical protein
MMSDDDNTGNGSLLLRFGKRLNVQHLIAALLVFLSGSLTYSGFKPSDVRETHKLLDALADEMVVLARTMNRVARSVEEADKSRTELRIEMHKLSENVRMLLAERQRN